MIVTRKMAEEAWAVLARSIGTIDGGALEEVTEDRVNSRFRYCALFAHPDRDGGTVEKFAEVDRAKHVLLEWLKRGETAQPVQQKQDCQRCGGTGYVTSQRGFRAMRVSCPLCRGSGDADYDHDDGDHFQGR